MEMIMQAIRSILVVMEPNHTEDLAHKRAKLIAGVTQSHLHLLVCDKKSDHTGYLRDLTGLLNSEGFTTSNDNPLKKALLTPDDWKLLRYCPAPVLMVKTEKSWAGTAILAAVDVGNADSEHRTLHTSIVSHG